MANPNKPTVVRCTTCTNGRLPVINHLMRCALSKYKVHTGIRTCPHYLEGNARPPE